MANFFYKLGRFVGPKVRQANWVLRSLTGTDAEVAQAEYAVGRDLAQAIARQMEIEQEPAAEEILADLKGRLGGCVKDRSRRFSFSLVRTPEVNAFALPGGFVFVTRPLLHLCGGNRDELAFVLGHEMGHVLRRHAMDRLMANTVISAAVGRWTRAGGWISQPVTGVVTGLLSQGYSQDQELEADRLGVQLARAAGFDTTAAVRLLARLQAYAGDPSMLGGYFSSHPPLAVRVEQLNRLQTGR